MTTNPQRPTRFVIAFASLAIAVAGLAICHPQSDRSPESVSQTSASTKSLSPVIAGVAALQDDGRPQLTVVELAGYAIVYGDELYHAFRLLLQFNPFSPIDWARVPRALGWMRIVPIYSANNDDRARPLIFRSEDLRHVPEIWERAWPMEMPDVATPYRVHGGVLQVRISGDRESGCSPRSSIFDLHALFAKSTPRLRTAMALNSAGLLSRFPWSMNVTSLRWWAVAVAFTASDKGIIPIFSPRGETRIHQLIFDSETLRHIPEIWERLWGMEMPDLDTPYRVHGGVI